MGIPWDETSSDVAARLRSALESLEDGEFLVVGEPAAAGEAGRRLFRRRSAPARRYVQFRAAGGWLYGECVGSVDFGGDWPVSVEQDAAIRAAGWLAPGDDDPTQTQPAYPNYWRTVPADQVEQLAGLGVTALKVLDLAPETVEFSRGQA